MAVNTTNRTSGNHQPFFLTLFSFRLHDILKWYTNGAPHLRRWQRRLYALMPGLKLYWLIIEFHLTQSHIDSHDFEAFSWFPFIRCPSFTAFMALRPSEDVGHAILSANGISEPSRMLEELLGLNWALSWELKFHESRSQVAQRCSGKTHMELSLIFTDGSFSCRGRFLSFHLSFGVNHPKKAQTRLKHLLDLRVIFL